MRLKRKECRNCGRERVLIPSGQLRCPPCANARVNEWRRLHREARDATTLPFPDLPGVRFSLIPEYPGYAASDDGRIWSCRRKTIRKWREMRNNGLDRQGYYRVTLNIGGNRQRYVFIHRLILLAFVGPPRDGQWCCCHGDGTRTNNRLDNLRWGDAFDNMNDKVQHGTDPRGDRNPMAKLTEADVIQIRELAAKRYDYFELAARFGVVEGTIHQIVRRTTWKHL